MLKFTLLKPACSKASKAQNEVGNGFILPAMIHRENVYNLAFRGL